jgi:hypothetical protein
VLRELESNAEEPEEDSDAGGGFGEGDGVHIQDPRRRRRRRLSRARLLRFSCIVVRLLLLCGVIGVGRDSEELGESSADLLEGAMARQGSLLPLLPCAPRLSSLSVDRSIARSLARSAGSVFLVLERVPLNSQKCPSFPLSETTVFVFTRNQAESVCGSILGFMVYGLDPCSMPHRVRSVGGEKFISGS